MKIIVHVAKIISKFVSDQELHCIDMRTQIKCPLQPSPG